MSLLWIQSNISMSLCRGSQNWTWPWCLSHSSDMDWNLLSWLVSWGNVWFWFEIFQGLLFLPKGTIFCSNKNLFSQTNCITTANLITERFYTAGMLWDQKENTSIPVGPPAMTKLHLLFYYSLPQCQEPASRLCWLHTVFSSVICAQATEVPFTPSDTPTCPTLGLSDALWLVAAKKIQEDTCPPSIRPWGEEETWAILCHEAKCKDLQEQA